MNVTADAPTYTRAPVVDAHGNWHWPARTPGGLGGRFMHKTGRKLFAQITAAFRRTNDPTERAQILSTLNDEQLRAYARFRNVEAPAGAKRTTLIRQLIRPSQPEITKPDPQAIARLKKWITKKYDSAGEPTVRVDKSGVHVAFRIKNLPIQVDLSYFDLASFAIGGLAGGLGAAAKSASVAAKVNRAVKIARAAQAAKALGTAVGVASVVKTGVKVHRQTSRNDKDPEKATRTRGYARAGADVGVAGLVVVAADTGRVLLIQRAHDEKDPASGTWEAPGGHLADGESPIEGAIREWREETGLDLPDGHVVGEWEAGRIYKGFVYEIESEDTIDILAGRNADSNPDSSGDLVEAIAWWDCDHLTADNPALRTEFRQSLPAVHKALKSATRLVGPQFSRKAVETAVAIVDTLLRDSYAPHQQAARAAFLRRAQDTSFTRVRRGSPRQPHILKINKARRLYWADTGQWAEMPDILDAIERAQSEAYRQRIIAVAQKAGLNLNESVQPGPPKGTPVKTTQTKATSGSPTHALSSNALAYLRDLATRRDGIWYQTGRGSLRPERPSDNPAVRALTRRGLARISRERAVGGGTISKVKITATGRDFLATLESDKPDTPTVTTAPVKAAVKPVLTFADMPSAPLTAAKTTAKKSMRSLPPDAAALLRDLAAHPDGIWWDSSGRRKTSNPLGGHPAVQALTRRGFAQLDRDRAADGRRISKLTITSAGREYLAATGADEIEAPAALSLPGAQPVSNMPDEPLPPAPRAAAKARPAKLPRITESDYLPLVMFRRPPADNESDPSVVAAVASRLAKNLPGGPDVYYRVMPPGDEPSTKHGMFLAHSKGDTLAYALGSGNMWAVRIESNAKIASEEDLVSAARAVGMNTDLDQYNGAETRFYPLADNPKVRAELARRGFHGAVFRDTTGNADTSYDHHTTVMWDPYYARVLGKYPVPALSRRERAEVRAALAEMQAATASGQEARPNAPGSPTSPPEGAPRAPAAARYVAGRDLSEQLSSRENKRALRKAYLSYKDRYNSDVYVGDETLTHIARAQGWWGTPPHIGTAEDLDAAIAAGGVEIWRGVYGRNWPQKKWVNPQDWGDETKLIDDPDWYRLSTVRQWDELKAGTPRYGRGIYGHGIYTTVDREVAESFAEKRLAGLDDDGGWGSVRRMVLRPGARVVNWQDLVKNRPGELDVVKERVGGRNGIPMNAGYVAAILGYDAILVQGKHDRDNPNYADQYIVLNPSALLFEEPSP